MKYSKKTHINKDDVIASLQNVGIIVEYVGRTFEQSKNRPVYIAKEILEYDEK